MYAPLAILKNWKALPEERQPFSIIHDKAHVVIEHTQNTNLNTQSSK